MRDYETWRLRDRSFAWALAISLLWHSFWFFSITVTVSPHKSSKKVHPRIVSLGSVLDDTLLRTLVENKPQWSETFYRHLSDLAPAPEIRTRTAERRSPGEVVGLPFGKRFMISLREIMGRDKLSPDFDFCRDPNRKYRGLLCPEEKD